MQHDNNGVWSGCAMTVLMLLAGIFILGTCLAFFVSPSLVDELSLWLGKQRNLHYVVVLRLLLGVLFLIGASQTDYPQAIRALGVLFIAAAVLLFALPAEKIKSITEYYLNRPVWVVRSWIAVPMMLGLFIIYSVL
jgi:hypothetical protein